LLKPLLIEAALLLGKQRQLDDKVPLINPDGNARPLPGTQQTAVRSLAEEFEKYLPGRRGGKG
jgi:hypothetical protein